MKSGGGADSYWPGFVDALTNVVIAMIFVVVVLALSLSFAAQIMAKKMAERLVRENTTSVAAAAVPAAPALIDSPDSKLPAPTKIPVAGNESGSIKGGGKLKTATNVFELSFAPEALTLDEAAQKQLSKEVSGLGLKVRSGQVEIVGRGPNIELSENQRLAYMRVMSTRNGLLDAGISPQNITVRIDTVTDTAKPVVIVNFKN